MKIQHLERNTIGRDYFVADLHGCYSLLMQGLRELGFDRSTDRLICAGDLTDRGRENDQCLSLLDEPWFYSVRGNHDAMAAAALCEFANLDINPLPFVEEWEIDSAFHPDNGVIQWLPKSEICRNRPKAEAIVDRLLHLPHLIVVETAMGRRYVCHAELDVNKAGASPFFITDQWIDQVIGEPESRRPHLYPIPNYLSHIRWVRHYGLLARKMINLELPRASALSPVFCGHTPQMTARDFAGYLFADLGAYASLRMALVDIETGWVTEVEWASSKVL